jgi:hypothetical protein
MIIAVNRIRAQSCRTAGTAMHWWHGHGLLLMPHGLFHCSSVKKSRPMFAPFAPFVPFVIGYFTFPPLSSAAYPTPFAL